MELQSMRAMKRILENAFSNTEIETCSNLTAGSTQPASTRWPAMHPDAAANTSVFLYSPLALIVQSS
jgi:hypothetical protein